MCIRVCVCVCAVCCVIKLNTNCVVLVTPAAPYQPSANQLEHTTALVCWEAPTSQTGNPVVSYVVERRRTDQDTWEIAASDITSCSFICKGLLPGQEYQFRIIAVYKEGCSKPSDPTGVVSIDELGVSVCDGYKLLRRKSFAFCRCQ